MYEIEPARMFIDQLEMIEVKTKGNLSPEEAKLLQQSLTRLRLSFVDAVEHPPKVEAPPAAEAEPKGAPAAEPKPAAETIQPAGEPDSDAEARKKFSKKY
jgi:hypothetical protein